MDFRRLPYLNPLNFPPNKSFGEPNGFLNSLYKDIGFPACLLLDSLDSKNGGKINGVCFAKGGVILGVILGINLVICVSLGIVIIFCSGICVVICAINGIVL